MKILKTFVTLCLILSICLIPIQAKAYDPKSNNLIAFHNGGGPTTVGDGGPVDPCSCAGALRGTLNCAECILDCNLPNHCRPKTDYSGCECNTTLLPCNNYHPNNGACPNNLNASCPPGQQCSVSGTSCTCTSVTSRSL